MAKRRKYRLTDPTPQAYTFRVHPKGTLSLGDVDLGQELTHPATYEKELLALQKKIFQRHVEHFQAGRRTIFVFEGWDAAGKGGVIRRFTTLMDPRGYKVWPISAPRDEERRQHYLWRFWARLPEFGEIAVFDRSWYGRVLVERVEGFCSEAAWQRAYDEINAFERMLTQDGVRLVKFFLHIDKKTQLKRFKARETDPLKNYKIGPDDWRNRKQWQEYEAALQDMFDRTHRPDAPWLIVPANDKKFARLAVLREIAKVLKEG